MFLSLFTVKFLEILKPFISVLPEVAKPERKVRLFVSVVECMLCSVQKLACGNLSFEHCDMAETSRTSPTS